MTGKPYKWALAVTGTLLFLTGVAIYLLFRSRELLGFKVVDALGLGSTADEMRECAEGVHLPHFVLYCLPDGLWTTAYILTMEAVFCNKSTAERLSWAAVIPALGASSEMLQLAGICPGVFDIFDLLCYTTPYIIYMCLLCHKHLFKTDYEHMLKR